MSTLWSVLPMIGAVALVFGPLLLLGLYVLADYFVWPIAGCILRIVAVALTLQFVAGALVNIALGVAVTGLAVWAVQNFASAWRFPGAAAVMILGIWRAWRGLTILRGGYEEYRRPSGTRAKD
jgi:hypothetical protein